MKTRLFFLMFALFLSASFVSAETNTLFPQKTLNPVLIQETGISQQDLEFEKNTSLSRFPINLGKNFLKLWDSRNLEPFLIGAGATGAFRSVDEEFHEYFQNENTRDFVANTGATLGKPYVLAPALGSLLIMGHFSSDKKFHAFSYAMAQGFVINSITTLALKDVAHRTRPDGSDNYSFPSGHTSDFFTIATITDSYYGHKAGIFAYTLASFVAFSRVKRDVHYMSDVIAGATMGYIVGRTVARSIGIPDTKRVSWMPVVDPINRSLGVSLAFRLP